VAEADKSVCSTKQKLAPASFARRGHSQRVDSRKGAFAPNLLVTAAHRATATRLMARDVAMKRSRLFAVAPMARRATAARIQHVDIRDEAFVPGPSSRWPVAPLRLTVFSTLTTATERSCCFRRLDGPSHHLGRLRSVDIRDRAFGPEPLASMTYRVILGDLNTLTSAIERSC
jgi:hypothetical protein